MTTKKHLAHPIFKCESFPSFLPSPEVVRPGFLANVLVILTPQSAGRPVIGTDAALWSWMNMAGGTKCTGLV
jgi:hypothetical protein